MFYSHTFLARKGPLGTVWLAAHLQHKLKKSHYTNTNIPSTVERIIYPEVPIALRMSGHLLLGVVRIYSKKVDYLHHDCNSLWVSLRNAFRPVDVNLQENAIQAQFNAVTLPETYQLDALDIDVVMSLDDPMPDHHLKSHEDITLTDQYSSGELYVRITFDDDVTPDLSRSGASPHRELDTMEIDNPPQGRATTSHADGDGDGDSGLGRQSEHIHGRFGEGSSLPDIPDAFERLRDHHGDDNQTLLPEELLHQPNISPQKSTHEEQADTPLHERLLAPPVLSPQSSQRSGPSSPPDHGFPGAFDPFVNITPPELTLRSTPPPENPLSPLHPGALDSLELRLRSTPAPEKPVSPLRPTRPPEEPQQRRRRKRQFFDESLVLSNEFLKNALNDPSNLVKKRKKLPCSALDIWRFRNNRKKEHIFSESLMSGLCSELQSVSNRDVISVKTRLVLSDNIELESRISESPARITIDGMEIERIRSPDHDAGHNVMHKIVPSPQHTPQCSPQNIQTSSSPAILESVSEPRFDTTMGSGSKRQFGIAFNSESDRGTFTGSVGLGLETPFSDIEGRNDGSNAVLSDIPELRGSAESDELSFLEQDNTPPDSQGPRESGAMSVRTRAVAKYLIDYSPPPNHSGSVPEELSLNNILEGKSRKTSARMFYETLVLKNYGLIDVRQDEPYGDIKLKLTDTLSKDKI